MVARQSVCLRQLSEGERAREVGFGRLLDNDKVTVERLIAAWSEGTGAAPAGRHVLEIQDTSEISFSTKPGQRRGLGEIGKGTGHGLLVHAMLALDAGIGSCLGLVAGEVYTRKGRVSRRWIDTARQAKTVLSQAEMVTVAADRESDIYTLWASLPDRNFHLIGRVMHGRAVAGGGTLCSVMAALPFVAERQIKLMATHKRAARSACLSLRYSKVTVLRPEGPDARGLLKLR